eukprot:Skav222748  [mRNA]  locus=scaffold2390:581403:594839:- [translate_table: standard]
MFASRYPQRVSKLAMLPTGDAAGAAGLLAQVRRVRRAYYGDCWELATKGGMEAIVNTPGAPGSQFYAQAAGCDKKRQALLSVDTEEFATLFLLDQVLDMQNTLWSCIVIYDICITFQAVHLGSSFRSLDLIKDDILGMQENAMMNSQLFLEGFTGEAFLGLFPEALRQMEVPTLIFHHGFDDDRLHALEDATAVSREMPRAQLLIEPEAQRVEAAIWEKERELKVKAFYRRAQARLGPASAVDTDRDAAIQAMGLHGTPLQVERVRNLLAKLRADKKKQELEDKSTFGGLFQRGEVVKGGTKSGRSDPQPMPTEWDLNDPKVQEYLDIRPGPAFA